MFTKDAVYIVAEAGVNHNGSLERAMQMIDMAVEAGADAVKFQSFKADNIISGSAPKAEYQKKTTSAEETQLAMVKKLELSRDAHKELIDHCIRKGIQFLSTPFDIESVELLVHTFDLPRLKISSGDLTNGPLLLRAAMTEKQIILSTGMSTIGEIETALEVLAFGYIARGEKPSSAAFKRAYRSEEGQKALREKVILLHCTTEYPALFTDSNLRVIDTLRSTFGLAVGLSDHTLGIAVPIAAVARGAVVIEKHFTLDRNLPGPDHKASLEPAELIEMVRSIRQVEAALGSQVKKPASSECKNITAARKSLVAAKDITEGEIFTEDNLTFKRPGSGISPMQYWDWLGKSADRSYKRDELVGV
ncbi:MAG: N-acetylneuraminate synthase [Bacillota bacterium]